MLRIRSYCDRAVCYQHGIIRMVLILFFVFSLLPGIFAQEPTPTLTPDEFIASKIEDIVGVWEQHFMSGVAYIQYQEDGAWKLAYSVKDLETRPMMNGTFWFEGTVFTTKDNYGQGAYEVRVTKEGGRAVHLGFSVIEDSLHDRIRDLSAGMTRIDQTTENIASKAEDIAGIWKMPFLGTEAHIHYKTDGTFNIAYTVEMLKGDPARRSPGVSGNFWFEGTVFFTKDNASRVPGTYEVRVQKEGDTPSRLSFRAIEDPDNRRIAITQRRDDLG